MKPILVLLLALTACRPAGQRSATLNQLPDASTTIHVTPEASRYLLRPERPSDRLENLQLVLAQDARGRLPTPPARQLIALRPTAEPLLFRLGITINGRPCETPSILTLSGTVQLTCATPTP